MTPDQVATYVSDLANRHTRELGFLPNTAYAPAFADGRLHLVEENGQPCGFVFHGRKASRIRVWQTCVEPSCQLKDHGREAWLQVMKRTLDQDCERITWVCADDLPANEFWRRVACDPKPRTTQRAPDRRQLYEYEYLLPAGEDLEQYLEEQYRRSNLHRIAQLHGIDQWLEEQFKKRWRKARR